MATTINKQRLLNHLLAGARKAAGDDPDGRPVLQQFIYGLCREDATPEQADRAYRNLCERFFDWNEVRVSSARELEEVFAGMSGFRWMPRKMSGMAMSTIDWLIVAMRMPSVVFESAIHL